MCACVRVCVCECVCVLRTDFSEGDSAILEEMERLDILFRWLHKLVDTWEERS